MATSITYLIMEIPSGHLQGKIWNVNAHHFSHYGNDSYIDHAIIHADTASLGGRGGIGSLMCKGDDLYTGGTYTGRAWDIRADHFSQKGSLELGQLNLKTRLWTQSARASLTADAYVDVKKANLKGSIWGPGLQGHINDFHLHKTGHIGTDHVSIGGTNFTNKGNIWSTHGVNLDYYRYHDFGALGTPGTLGLTLNDRWINEDLLRHFDQRFACGDLALHTNQPLTFTQDFYFSKGLSLSAPSINFDGQSPGYGLKGGIKGFRFSSMVTDPYYRANFAVNGPLRLEARAGNISTANYNIASSQMRWDSRGQINIHNSGLMTQDLMHLKADHGFTITPKEIRHATSSTKSSYFGFKKRTTTREWNEILQSSLISNGGAVFLESPYGGATFDSLSCSGGQGVYASMRGQIERKELLVYDTSTTKKRDFFTFAKNSSSQEGDSPSVFTSLGEISLLSHQEGIHLPNTVLLAPRVLLDAQKDVFLSLPSLRSEHSYKRNGLTFSHAFSDFNKDPAGALLNLDPVTASLKGLYNARNQHPINQLSAGIMGGINLFNAYKGYQEAKNLTDFMTGRLLSSVGRVEVGYHDEEGGSYHTSPGQGGIFADEAVIRSRTGNVSTVNGVPLNVRDLLIDCPNGSWIRGGFESRYGGYSNSFNMAVGGNVLTQSITDVSMSACSRDYEGTRWTPQSILTQNLRVNAKSILHKEEKDTFRHSQEGFGFSLSQNGGSFNVNGYGFSYAGVPGKGMMGSFGVQVKGINFVVPLADGNFGSSTQPQPVSSPPVKEEVPQAKQEENSPVDQPSAVSSKSPSKEEISRSEMSPTGSQSILFIANGEPLRATSGADYNGWPEDGWGDPMQHDDREGFSPPEEKSLFLAPWSGIAKCLWGMVTGMGQLVMDVAVLNTGAQEQSYRLRLGIEAGDISITNTHQYKQAKENMAERGESIKALGSFVKDSAIIVGCTLQESNMLERDPWEKDQTVHAYLTSTSLYQDAVRNMEDRVNTVSAIYEHFSGQSTFYKIEKFFEVGAPFFVSGAGLIAFKGTSLRSLSFNIPQYKRVSFSRDLSWRDLGILETPSHFNGIWDLLRYHLLFNPNKHYLDGKVIRRGNELYIYVENVESSKNSVRKVLTNLEEFARMSGAEKLILEGEIVNPKLLNFFVKRYSTTTRKSWRTKSKTTIEISIPPGTPDPTRLLLPAPNKGSKAGKSGTKSSLKKEDVN